MLVGGRRLRLLQGSFPPIVGTLALTAQNPPASVSTEGDPQEKHLPPSPSEAEGPTSMDNPPRDTLDNPPGLGDHFEKGYKIL